MCPDIAWYITYWYSKKCTFQRQVVPRLGCPSESLGNFLNYTGDSAQPWYLWINRSEFKKYYYLGDSNDQLNLSTIAIVYKNGEKN